MPARLHHSSALVTGGAGFVGASLCAALVRSGERVTVVDDLTSGSPDNWADDVRDEIELFRADVRDTQTMAEIVRAQRPAAIYHLAAIHFIPACDADPARAVSVNVVGAQTLLSVTAAANGLKTKMILASTGAVYAPSDAPHAERDRLEPTDIYGLSKLWMEQAADLHHRRSGASIGIARLFNVVGAGETNPHLTPEIIHQAKRSERVRLGNLDTRRDYIAVDDVSDGLIALAANLGESEVLTCNLGAERAVDGHHLIRVLSEVMGRDLEVEFDPGRMRVSDRPVLESDCTRAHERLGWRAKRSLEDALRAAVQDGERFRNQSFAGARTT